MWPKLKKLSFSHIWSLIKLGDLVVFSLSLIGVIFLYFSFWQKNVPTTVIIYQGGRQFQSVSLQQHQWIYVTGPLGISLIEIDQQRARVYADPSPRQYCVKQGWLTRVGEIAMCLPNQVHIELVGRFPAEKKYDSFTY